MSKKPRGKIRIALVDDDAVFREGAARLLGSEPDFEVVARCATLEDVFKVIASDPIDIVLLDFDPGRERSKDFFTRAQKRGFPGRLLIVTAGLSDSDVAYLISHGAAGIVDKHGASALLAESIRTVMEGEAWLDQRYLVALTRLLAPRNRGAGTQFTERERSVLRGLIEGQINKEIAGRLQISESAVKATVQQLFNKTGVRNRSQLVRVVLERYQEQL